MPQEIIEPGKGRRMLLLLIALFALPVVVVVGMYKLDWRPSGSSHGELVTPPVALHPGTQRDTQGKAFAATQWKAKWSMVYIDASGCAEACQNQIHMLRQVHVSLNKEIDRVQRILLLTSPTEASTIAGLQQKYPDLVMLTGDAATALSHQFDLPGQPAASAARVYLVDPLGNLMMSYPRGYQPKGLLDDMNRLLKYSWVG